MPRDLLTPPRDLLSDGWKEPDYIREEKYGTITTTPSITERFLSSEGLPLAGAIGGGIIGGLSPVPGGAAMGTALGAGAGTAAKQIGQYLTGSENAPQTSWEAAKEIGTQAGIQGTADIVGTGMLKAGKALYPHVAPQFVREGVKQAGEEIAPFVNKYIKQGFIGRMLGGDKPTQILLPSQVADEWSNAGKWQSILESSFTGGGPIKQRKYAQAMGIKDYIDDTVNSLFQPGGAERLSNIQMGEQTQNAIELAQKSFHDAASGMYSALDDKAGQAKIVDYKPVIKWIDDTLKGRVTGRSEFGDGMLNNLKKDLESSEGIDTFMGAHDMRARLNTMLSYKDADTPSKMLANKAKDLITQQMEKGAKDVGDISLFHDYMKINTFYRAGAQRFQNDFINSLTKKAELHPSLVANMIFKNDQPELIKMVKRVVGGNSPTWKNLEAGFVENTIESAKDIDGTLLGPTFWKKIKSFGPENINQILNPEIRHRLNLIDTYSNAIQRTPPGGGGSMLVQLIQASAASGLITGAYFTQSPELLAGAGAVLVSPYVLGKMLTHPTYGKWFLEGMKPGIKTEQSIKIINKLVAAGTHFLHEEHAKNQAIKTQNDLLNLPGQTIQGGR